jgi:hypothetical protein
MMSLLHRRLSKRLKVFINLFQLWLYKKVKEEKKEKPKNDEKPKSKEEKPKTTNEAQEDDNNKIKNKPS